MKSVFGEKVPLRNPFEARKIGLLGRVVLKSSEVRGLVGTHSE
jgi:hypothetical protein